MIRLWSSFGNALNECFRGLPLDLPCCFVVANLESGGKCAGQSDDHEDEADGQESNWSGFEVRDEDGDASGA